MFSFRLDVDNRRLFGTRRVKFYLDTVIIMHIRRQFEKFVDWRWSTAVI